MLRKSLTCCSTNIKVKGIKAVSYVGLRFVDIDLPKISFNFSIRTQEGKSYARRHNPKYHEGRPKVYSDEKIWQAYQLHQKGMTYRELSLRTGISISTLRRRFTLIKSVEIRDHEK